jgi:hypothetical protein
MSEYEVVYPGLEDRADGDDSGGSGGGSGGGLVPDDSQGDFGSELGGGVWDQPDPDPDPTSPEDVMEDTDGSGDGVDWDNVSDIDLGDPDTGGETETGNPEYGDGPSSGSGLSEINESLIDWATGDSADESSSDSGSSGSDDSGSSGSGDFWDDLEDMTPDDSGGPADDPPTNQQPTNQQPTNQQPANQGPGDNFWASFEDLLAQAGEAPGSEAPETTPDPGLSSTTILAGLAGLAGLAAVYYVSRDGGGA